MLKRKDNHHMALHQVNQDTVLRQVNQDTVLRQAQWVLLHPWEDQLE
jgi:hypothetical protein